MSRFIGITGGIGSGKSRVSRFWTAYAKLPLIDIDQLCRELLEIGKPGWVALKQVLGEAYFNSNGELDRKGLRRALFADSQLRQVVDQCMHPLALDMLYDKTAGLEGDILVDVPLLFEAGWENHCRCTVVVYADQQTCCQRLCNRDRIPPEEAVRAISAQMDMREKVMLADHVIDNRYNWVLARMQVAHLARFIHNDRTGVSQAVR